MDTTLETTLLRQDADGWSRSFDDQRQYSDPKYAAERALFWAMMDKLRKEDDVRLPRL